MITILEITKAKKRTAQKAEKTAAWDRKNNNQVGFGQDSPVNKGNKARRIP